jgi:ankyrin repeat protein
MSGLARRSARARRFVSTNTTASASVIALPPFWRCARASSGDSLNRTTLPPTTAVAFMASAYAKASTDTSDPAGLTWFAADGGRCDYESPRLKPRRQSCETKTSIMASGFLDFVRVVVAGDVDRVSRVLADTPTLATTAAGAGATRQTTGTFFFTDIAHYMYAGDTALHMAAAAFRRQVAALLVARGATCRARNRRGAEPLHYAADANRWDPIAQADTIDYLLSVGADPNALDRSGVSPLHRCQISPVGSQPFSLDRGPLQPRCAYRSPICFCS